MGICSNATVTNSGALWAAVFDFSVPQGIQGATVIWVAVHDSDVCGDLRDLLFASSPDLRKSALFIFEMVLHRRKSFDNGLDFLPELGSGQIIPLKNGSGSYANLLVTRFARVGNTSRQVKPTWLNSESSGLWLWHPI